MRERGRERESARMRKEEKQEAATLSPTTITTTIIGE